MELASGPGEPKFQRRVRASQLQLYPARKGLHSHLLVVLQGFRGSEVFRVNLTLVQSDSWLIMQLAEGSGMGDIV